MLSKSYGGGFVYKGLGGCESICNLKILPQKNETSIVVLSELSENPGNSITNCFDGIATQIYHQFFSTTSVHQITWIEHYNENSYSGKNDREETFDQVMLSWDEKKSCFNCPHWKHIGST